MIVFLCFAVLLVTSNVAARDINVDVKANWDRPSLSFIAEVSEYMSDNDNSGDAAEGMFWNFVDNLCYTENFSDKLTKLSDIELQISNANTENVAGGLPNESTEFLIQRDELINEIQSTVNSAATELTTLTRSAGTAPLFQALMESQIGLGAYSPSVAFYQSLSQTFYKDSHPPCNGEAFVVTYPGELVSCTAELSSKGRSGDSNDFGSGYSGSWDHSIDRLDLGDDITPEDIITSKERQVHAVLYGVVGSASFCRLHRDLMGQISNPFPLEDANTNAGSLEKYTVRHSFPPSSLSATSEAEQRLQGFGVFLDIKNMEYKNVDDEEKSTNDEDSGDAQTVEFLETEEIMGVNLHKLSTSISKLSEVTDGPDADRPSRSDLVKLRESLLKLDLDSGGSGGGSGGEMKSWRMKDLGIQTLKLISSTKAQFSDHEAMEKFADIVQNFPKYAPMVSSVKVSKKLRTDVMWWYQSGVQQVLPMNSIFINGKRQDLSGATFNLFDVLDQVKEEATLLHKLESLSLPAGVASKVEEVAKEVGGGSSAETQEMGGPIIRIDVSKGAKRVVTFLNNIERDKLYKSWPRKLETLLYPSWSLHTIGRNLYTIIGVADIFTYGGASLLLEMAGMKEQQYPLRFGMVFACTPAAPAIDMGAPTEGSGDAQLADSADFCTLFAYAKQTHSSELALNFAYTVAQDVQVRLSDSSPPEDDDNLYQEGAGLSSVGSDTRVVLTRAELVTLYGSAMGPKAKKSATEAEAADALQKGITQRATVTGRGDGEGERGGSDLVGSDGEKVDEAFLEFGVICEQFIEARGLRVNSFSLNGIVVNEASMQSSMMQLIGREQYILSNYVRQGVITDKTKSMFSSILNAGKAYARYHPMLDEKTCTYLDFGTERGKTVVSSLEFGHANLPDKTGTSSPLDSAIVVVPVSKQGFVAAQSAINWALLTAAANDDDENSALQARIAIVHAISGLDSNADSSKSCKASKGGDSNACSYQPDTTDRDIMVLLALVRLFYSDTDADTDSKKEVYKDSCTTECLTMLAKTYGLLAEGQRVDEVAKAVAPRLKKNTVVSKDDEDMGFMADFAHILGSKVRARRELVHAKKAFDQVQQLREDTSEGDASYKEEVVVIYNARVVVSAPPSGKDSPILHEEDLALLAKLEDERIGAALREKVLPAYFTAVGQAVVDTTILSDVFLHMSSFCGIYESISGQKHDVVASLQEIGLDISGDHNFGSMIYKISPSRLSANEDYTTYVEKPLQIWYVLDPLSKAGQRGASLIPLFRDHLRVEQTIILLPNLEITEFPLQSFYRFVSAPFDSSKAVAAFTNLPRQNTLTARVDIPEPWNVQTKSAQQDIDNLRCIAGKTCGDSDNDKELTRVSYELKNVLVSGQCFQTAAGDSSMPKRGLPPNGLQLTLTPAHSYTSGNATTSDTLVMQNLGYFQLQANPGLFVLHLAQGRATNLYTINNAEESGGLVIPVRTFSDTVHRLGVKKRPGMESVSLLDDPNDPNQGRQEDGEKGKEAEGVASIIGTLGSMFKSAPTPKRDLVQLSTPEQDETIHVFSLATGHMYERLLRIMMLSVHRKTSVPVKFWLFENYLSPTFKNIAAAMAAEYGFEVGYVTYKWPQWLNQQTQQQRIIWGFKILFLDVLFPLSVKKVIYVDADQVIRSDLKELWDLDLEGKPYAYTPFCTSNEETLGFQFWQTGFWKTHLRDKPYHISALYVVDLQNFRRNAVGDTLRSVYDNLSRDPNSLANLDQDLPNYAQHQVPIYSLPQDWLWCETWCSGESKATAKTIDLCNSPLYKEPKLDMARRIISGDLFEQSWVEFDEEIKVLQQRTGFIAIE